MSVREATRDSSTIHRVVLIGIVAGAVMSITAPIPLVGEALLLIGVVLGWWLVPRFWRSVLFGAVGGVVSGILILGVGFRVAMRVVAILDPIRVPEFSIDGTMFILIGIGGVFGGIMAILGNLARRGLRLTSAVTAGILPAAGALSLLFADTEIRQELFELGAGAWVNIPMFGLVAILYGIGAGAVTNRLERRSAQKRSDTERIEVPA